MSKVTVKSCRITVKSPRSLAVRLWFEANDVSFVEKAVIEFEAKRMVDFHAALFFGVEHDRIAAELARLFDELSGNFLFLLFGAVIFESFDDGVFLGRRLFDFENFDFFCGRR